MIFMECSTCGNNVDEAWIFCPKCGSRLRRGPNGDLMGFSDIFRDMKKELDRMSNTFEKNFEVFDMRPFFSQPVKGKGFTIKITTRKDENPDVSIQTFGDIDPMKVQQNISKCINCKPQNQKSASRNEKPPKITEEPATNVRRMGESVVMEVSLPGVAGMKDVQVNDLESSVEVRARAGDKAYFKILTKPEAFKLADKKFSNDILFLEFK